ncbi:Bro-N domain-containing protein [Kitasatospora sp. NPDC006697]|uniref:BRO-N domain-containing protein n=1 Tax=Kitasatospora sp. NPDC006697 TaxID=3364020 RepID=UPI0036C74D06
MTNHQKRPLIPFDFDGQEVRVVMINGDPWWVARDVCAVLEISNPRHVLWKTLEEDEKAVVIGDTPGGDQQLSIVNEPGLYSLVLRSRKPKARAFKRWLTHEVIPAIRRTGRYVPSEPPRTEWSQALVAEVAGQAVERMERRHQELLVQLAALEERHAELTRRVRRDEELLAAMTVRLSDVSGEVWTLGGRVEYLCALSSTAGHGRRRRR